MLHSPPASVNDIAGHDRIASRQTLSVRRGEDTGSLRSAGPKKRAKPLSLYSHKPVAMPTPTSKSMTP